MKKVPAKYSRCGIKVKCLKCAWLVNETCRLSKKSLGSCQHKDKHRYIFIIHIPNTKSGRVIKLAKSESFDDALAELIAYKEELKRQGYHKVEVKVEKLDTTVAGMMKEYLNYISGNGTHAHLNKTVSNDHIAEYKRVFLRFCDAIKKKGYNPEILDVKNINDTVVECFHFYIEKLQVSRTTYSKHFVMMKAFINWIIEKKDYKMNNAFDHVSLMFGRREKNIITKEVFEKLLEVTTHENGAIVDSDGKKRNRFRPWLKAAFQIGLETGLRREELISLKWSNLREIEHQGKSYFILDVSNLKVNRRMFGQDTGEYTKPIPVTKGLYNLLVSLGLEEKKGKDEYIIDRGDCKDAHTVMDSITRGFTHYIKLATDRKIEFKDLRKTYITKISLKLGKNTKLFTGHSDDQVLRASYIAEEFVTANLDDFSVFGEEKGLERAEGAV
jgi:integrase